VNQQTFDQHRRDLGHEAERIQEAKRPGYTRGDTDVLKNFKTAGEAAGITAEQAWAVFAKKHWDAILSIMTQPNLAVSEAPLGRFADLRNYLDLGWALLQERDGPHAQEATTTAGPECQADCLSRR
jgi:hypothetical protein